MVLIFSDSNKAQVYKQPYRYCSLDEIEVLMSFDYLNLFQPKVDTEVYQLRKPNDEIFPFGIEDERKFYLGEDFTAFETNDKIVKYSPELGYNDVKFPFAYGEENIFLCFIENIFLFKKMKPQQKKTSINIYRKKMMN